MPAQKTMRFKLRKIFSELEDSIEGTMLLSRKPVSFLGDIDVDTGEVVAGDSDVFGERIAGRIFAFPSGRGSTAGTYTLLQLAKQKIPRIFCQTGDANCLFGGNFSK